MKRIAIFGAGAIGGYLAWSLAGAGQSVSVVARGDQLAAIRKDGLALEIDGNASAAVRVAATDNPETLGPQDIVFVTLKHPGISAALEGLSALSSPRTTFVFATNGIPWWMEPELDALDTGGRLARLIAPDLRVGCVAKASIEVRTPGVISLDTASARFILGPACDEATSVGLAVRDVLTAAGIASSFETDLKPAIWDKLILNVAFGVPAAVLDLPVGQTAAQPEVQQVVKALIAEVRAIAHSRGVQTTVPDTVTSDPAILSSPHVPSLLQDLRKGRQTEIDALVTAPLLLARQAGLATPNLGFLGALIVAKARALGCYQAGAEPQHAA